MAVQKSTLNATATVRKRSSWLYAASPAALLFLGIGQPAFAQDDAEEAEVQQVEDEDSELDSDPSVDRVVVRGTGTNISGVAPVGSRVITLDSDDIQAVGVPDIADVLRTLPQVQRGNPGRSFSATQSSSSSAVDNIPNVTRGDAINLRGVGQDATLLLVNGRRVAASGTQQTFTEAVQVPLSAIERVEVIADGASAVYGSDAIAGVVNYVLRDDYEGFQINSSFGDNGYGQDWTVGAMGGTAWENVGRLGSGNILFTYEHGRENPIRRGKIPRYRQDQRPFGGSDGRVNNGATWPTLASNVVVSTDPDGAFGPAPGVPNPVFSLGGNFIYYGVPAGVENPTFATIAPFANVPNLSSPSDFEDWRAETDRDQFLVMFNQELTSRIGFFADGRYSRRDSFTRATNPSGVAAFPRLNVPYWLNNNPAGGTVHPRWFDAGQGMGFQRAADGTFFLGPNPLSVQYDLNAHRPAGVEFGNETYDENLTGTVGFDAELPAEWSGEVAYTYSETKNCGVCYFGNYVNTDTTDLQGRAAPFALQRLVNENVINPFSNAPLTTQQFDLFNGDNIQTSQFYNHAATMRFDGPLLDLPAGRMRAAFGGEYQHSNQQLQNGANRPPNNDFIIDANSDYSRDQYSLFGELYVPLVAEDMNVPLMQSFVVDVAARYDEYSDFGSTTNPKIGATWSLTDNLDFRGTWGTSFRAPSIPELQRGVFSFVLIGASFPNTSGVAGIPVNAQGQSTAINIVVGGNADLEAEEGTNMTFGVDWTHDVGPGTLRASGTWYRIAYDNRLGAAPSINEVFASASSASQFSNQYTVVTVAPNCNEADPTTWNPAVRDVLGSTPPYRIAIGNICDSFVIFDGTQTNIAGTLQEGVDLQLDYIVDSGIGLMNFGANLNYITKSEIQARETAPSLSNLDGDNNLFGGPVSLRGRAYVGWSDGPWSVNVFANHVGGFTVVPAVINGVTADADVPSWTTFDLNLGFNFDDSNWGGGVLRGTRVSMNINNFTDEDAPIVLTGNGTSSVNFNHDALGRSFRISLSKEF